MVHELNQSKIYLTKCLKVILPDGHGEVPSQVVATAAKNLQSLGFGLSSPLLQRLSALSEAEVVDWYASVLPVLEEMVAAHRSFLRGFFEVSSRGSTLVLLQS